MRIRQEIWVFYQWPISEHVYFFDSDFTSIFITFFHDSFFHIKTFVVNYLLTKSAQCDCQKAMQISNYLLEVYVLGST